MKVLITGGNGQLGLSVKKRAANFPQLSFLYTDVAELDITNYQAIVDFITREEIQAIVNCAAYTAVDKAEEQAELAFQINESGPLNLAKACKSTNCALVHISTDYVFSGLGHRPYQTDEPINPSSVYAKSKAAGEQAIQKISPTAWIIRTSWLYSEYGQNFVKTMIRLGRERDQLQVVADQIGSPCYAPDLADCILQILNQEKQGAFNKGLVKIYHYANTGCASWFDFTKSIHEIAGISCRVLPIPTENYPLPATRPYYSVLNTIAVQQDYGVQIPYWRDSLKNCIEILESQEK